MEYHCSLCNGRGIIPEDGDIFTKGSWRPCKCDAVKREMRLMEKSGLSRRIERCTFDSYTVEHAWQRSAKDKVCAWVEAIKRGDSPWLLFSGTPGSGKSHLCTAACGTLLASGKPTRYMIWAEEARRLKGCINDAVTFEEIMGPLRSVEVLYIDDLFKVQQGSRAITPADVRIAFELINARYNADKPTVISSEWEINDLLKEDEATFSRVYEMAQGYVIHIPDGEGRNYRLRRRA